MRYDHFTMLPERAFRSMGRKLMTLEGGGGKDGGSAPATPDYAGAAAVQAQGDQDAARVAAKANRVSQYTPYGNLVYTSGVNGDQDQWRADVSLAPEQKQLLDSQNRMSLGLANVGETGVGYVADKLNNPFDWQSIDSNTPAAKAGMDGWNQAYNSILDRSQPQWDRKQSSLETQLTNQGIGRGTEAWKNAMSDYDQAHNDFLLGAQQSAGSEQSRMYGLDQNARQQAIQEQSFARNEPLNMLNAVRSGSQVTNPTFTSSPQQATTAGPNLLGAMQAGYNADMAKYNAANAAGSSDMMALASLGGSAMMGKPWK
jgi:hypothetical protein